MLNRFYLLLLEPYSFEKLIQLYKILLYLSSILLIPILKLVESDKISS
jgi:hypothetical protein